MWGLIIFLFGAVLFYQTVDGTPCQKIIQLSDNETVLSSDNFPQNYEDYTMCRYLISAPENQRIKLIFTAFNVEQTESCISDSLKIFDLSKPSVAEALSHTKPCRLGVIKATVGPLCGDQIPNGFISHGNQIALEFCTDYAVVNKGFSVAITREPQPDQPEVEPYVENLEMPKISDHRTVRTPNFPKPYDNNRRCNWTIKTNGEYSLRIDIREFYVGDDCSDILSITDVTNNLFFQYCGSASRKAPTFVLLKNTSLIVIDFIPDAWDAFKGVDIELSYEVCPRGTYACDDYDGCVNATNYCDGVEHCNDKSDEKEEYCVPDCGVPHFPIHIEGQKITGGSSAFQYSLPWQVAMLSGTSQFCGGSLISDRWIVTAAHCFTSGNNPNYKARIGGHQLDYSVEDDRALLIGFEKVICHPYYGLRTTHDYDLCLIKLNQRVIFRKNIVPVCLPRQGDDPAPEKQCLVSGWGNTPLNRLTGDLSDTRQTRGTTELRQVYVPVVGRQACNASNVYNGQITDSMICAGVAEGGKDSCQGDSGGPFVCQKANRKWMLNGVVSWGYGCGRPGIPGVYSNVGSGVNWMINTIASN